MVKKGNLPKIYTLKSMLKIVTESKERLNEMGVWRIIF